jgi:class 3 adenylate cyclase
MQQEQPSRVGRRLAAIVAADVAGYSRLMGLDEVGTARTLREHRAVTDALVAKHGGRRGHALGRGTGGRGEGSDRSPMVATSLPQT